MRRSLVPLAVVGLCFPACFPFAFDTSTLVECVTSADCPGDGVCYPNGTCDAGVPPGGSSGSSGYSQGSSSSNSSSGTSQASSSSSSSSNSSSNSSSGTLTSSSSGSSSSGSSCASSGGTALPSRVLVTNNNGASSQIWDVTNPAAAQGIIGSADLLGDIPTAVTETSFQGDEEILVLLDSDGLVAFDSATEAYLGEIVVPVEQGNFQGGQGIVFAPQPCGGTPVVVVCGGENDEVTAFQYPGRSSFTGNGMAYPTALYTGDANYGGCAPGPDNTYFATGIQSVGWYDVLTGNPHGGGGQGTGFFAQSQGDVNGVAVDTSNNVFIVGDDGTGNNGFVALFNSSGICEQARSGGACTLSPCGSCIAGDPTLTGTPLYGAAYFNGMFLATASTTNQAAMNTILQVNPSSSLAVTSYLVGPTGTNFYGIFAAPQPL